jgi:hypothetical protein
MRVLAGVALAVGLILSTAANSTTIVQVSSNASPVQGGFASFDTSLGTLDSVTLRVDATDLREIGVSSYPDNTPIDLSWTVNGQLFLWLYDLSRGLSGGSFVVPLSGSGSATNVSYGFSFYVTGSATFNLDPAFFTVRYMPGYWPWDMGIHQSDPGFYYNGDVTVVTNHPDRIQLGASTCAGGDEACNFGVYTLTYNYTPFPAAVPEPSSWSMMLLGFGAIGLSMRRKPKNSQLTDHSVDPFEEAL